MHPRRSTAWAATGALSFLLALTVGCAQLQTGTRPSPPQAALTEAPSRSELDAEQQRRAQSMAHYATGVALEMEDGLAAAIEEYKTAFALNPQHTALAVRLGNIYLSRKDYTNAVAVLEQAAKANPKSAEPLFWLGYTYKATDQPTKALATLRQGLKLDPSNIAVIQQLVDIYLQQGSLLEVKKLIDASAHQNNTDPMYWARLGDTCALALKQKPSLAAFVDSGRVQQFYEKAASLAPKESEILLRLADVYADSNNFKAAADAYGKLLALRPDLPQLREKLALNYIRSGDKLKAAAVLEKIIQREPLRFEIYNYLGEIYEDLEEDHKAISNYQQSLVINPNQLTPALRVALLQLKAKQYDDVLQTLAKAKDKFPVAFQIPYFYGLVYSEKKDYPKSLAAFAEAENLALESPEPVKLDSSFYFYYAAAAERTGDIDKAATLFRKSIELDPKKHTAYNYLGYMWADKGVHLDEAYDLIKKALALEPDNGAYLDSLGWVLFRQGRYEEALTQLRRAAELDTEDASILDHLADVLLKLGKRDEALAQLRRAIEMEPSNKDIAEKLQKLLNEQSKNH